MRITGNRLRKIIREVISEQNARSEYMDPKMPLEVSDFISDMNDAWLELAPDLPESLRKEPKYLFDYLKDQCLQNYPGFDMSNMAYVKERFLKGQKELMDSFE